MEQRRGTACSRGSGSGRIPWREKVFRANHKDALLKELCAFKYAVHRYSFLAQLAKNHLKTLVTVVIFM
jgi:hypothetical protein